jgi:hypothetical protein
MAGKERMLCTRTISKFSGAQIIILESRKLTKSCLGQQLNVFEAVDTF